jgi:predicted acetyltransferase
MSGKAIEINKDVEYLLDAAVSQDDDRQLRELLSQCFLGPHNECFKTQRHFRIKAKHRFVLRDKDKIIRGNIAVHDLTIGTEQGDLRIAGIAEVAVDPLCRGKGYANLMLNHIHAWAAKEGFPFAMLYGDPKIYGSKGYVACHNITRYLDWDSKKTLDSPAMGGMNKPLKAGAIWPSGLIDLRGPTF